MVRIGAEGVDDAIDHAVDEAGKAEHQPGLNRLDGVLADDITWQRELNAAQLGSSASQSFLRKLDTRRDGATDVAVGIVDDVEDRRSSVGPPYSSAAASALTMRSAPTSRGLSVWMGTPVLTPGPTIATGVSA